MVRWVVGGDLETGGDGEMGSIWVFVGRQIELV